MDILLISSIMDNNILRDSYKGGFWISGKYPVFRIKIFPGIVIREGVGYPANIQYLGYKYSQG